MGLFLSKQKIREGNRVKLNKSQKGLNQGLWIEEIQDNQIQVFEMGDYFKGKRIGKWKCFLDNKQIAGGLYDDIGHKKGKWSELSKFFGNNRLIIHCGEYTKSGSKVGLWDIMNCKNNEKEYKLIGGGLYNQEENQKKIGKWVELNEDFRNNKQVIYNGEYNMNGMKVGRWDIMYCYKFQNEYSQMQKFNKYKDEYVYIEGVDYTIKKEIRKKLEGGLN